MCVHSLSLQVENDDGIWLKLSNDSIKIFCSTEVESWTLAVAHNSQVYLDQAQTVDSTPQVFTQQAFPTAAAVFSTPPQKSICGTSFQLKNQKLEFDGEIEEPMKSPLLKFGFQTAEGKQKGKSASHSKRASKEGEQEKESGPEVEKSLPFPPASPNKQALTSDIAECQRAVYAAFLWQEGLVHDAIVSASYLKFHPELSKEMNTEQNIKEGKMPQLEKGNKRKQEEDEEEWEWEGDVDNACRTEVEDTQQRADDTGSKDLAKTIEESTKAPSLMLTNMSDTRLSVPTLPPTLSHLVTFWDEISIQVLNNSSIPFPHPKAPAFVLEQENQCDKDKVMQTQIEAKRKTGQQADEWSTICELCDKVYPNPVTYHMKEVHPGCGEYGIEWGYNSEGTYLSGWAGNCGDGGQNKSTWYLMCKYCHSKYLSIKKEVESKAMRLIPLPNVRKPGKAHTFPVQSAVQGMIQNAMFLLEICPVENPATISEDVPPHGLLSVYKQSSYPGNADRLAQNTMNLPWEKSNTEQWPGYFRSVSFADKSSKSPSALRSKNDDTSEESFPHQQTTDSAISAPDQHATTPLVTKPSYFLAQLVHNRSKCSAEDKEVIYMKVLDFVLQYHDLNGLRITMKQSMRVAGVRAYAMEVRIRVNMYDK